MHGKERLRQQPFPMRGGQACEARSTPVNANEVRRDLTFYGEKRGMMKDFLARMESAREHLPW
jgi:hypothetical protein